jgi:hypothetical protein
MVFDVFLYRFVEMVELHIYTIQPEVRNHDVNIHQGWIILIVFEDRTILYFIFVISDR